MVTSKADPPSTPRGRQNTDSRYREMFEHSVAGMYRSSAEGRLLDANQALADILGYDGVEELFALDLGHQVYADPEHRDRLIERVESEGVIKDIQIELRRKDGSTITALGSMRGIRDADGHLATMEGSLVDISERERAVEALKASEQRYRRLVENLTDGVFETTPDGRMLRANQALVEMLGYDSEEELLAVPVSDQYAERDERRELVERTLAHDGIRNQELALLRKDGSVVYCLQNSRVVRDEEGEPVRFEGTLTDLSELRRAEISRRELEARRQRQNQALLELTRAARPDSIDEAWRLVTRTAGRTLEVERVGVWLFDDSGEQVRKACSWDASKRTFVSGDEIDTTSYPIHFGALREERVLAADDALADPRTVELRAAYLEPYGITSMLDVPIRTGGRLLGVLCHEHVGPRRHWSRDEIDFAASMASWLSQEIERHERRQAQEELRASERKYRDLFESTVSGFFRIDPEGHFLAANPAFLDMLGYDSEEEIRGLNLADDIYVDRGRRDELARAIAEEPLLTNVESELRRRDGSLLRVLGNIRRVGGDDGTIQYFEGSFVDVTERAELELQLRQSQKMEALGKLAGGVAHDFNNLITVMLGYIDLALAKTASDSPLVEDLEQIRDAADRAAAMTRHLLAYTRQQVLHPRLIDLNETVRDVSKLLERLIGENIRLVHDLADDIYPARVDPGQLQQVMINLAVNARDAMPQGGDLLLRTRKENLRHPERLGDFVIEPGRYAVLEVVDEGEGMDAETRRHALEPFFTTKPVGEGTGLGLSTAYGIVKQSGGYISISSQPGRGTRVDVYLPASFEEAGEGDGAEIESSGVPAAASSGDPAPTVLLVEDDEALRRLATSVLEDRGYRVLSPWGPDEALATARRIEEPLDLLVTDVVMPGMSGPELADRIHRDRPDLPVLYISGYPSDVPPGTEPLEESGRFLGKPFDPDELEAAVREILGSGASN